MGLATLFFKILLISSGYEGFTEVFLLFLRLRIALEYAYITSFFKFRITQPTHREQLFWGRDWGQTQGSSKSSLLSKIQDNILSILQEKDFAFLNE